MKRRNRVEDFLSAIEQLCQLSGEQLATTGQIASMLNMGNGTVSSRLRKLADEKLIEVVDYRGARLTKTGQSRLDIYAERLNTIESFLLATVQPAIECIDVESRCLEPCVSDKLLIAMQKVIEGRAQCLSDFTGNAACD